MGKVQVFISHRFEDRDLAKVLRRELRDLSLERIDVHVCEDIPGGEDWRTWIDDKIDASTIFVFLYTDERADWSWCLYEIGMFIGGHRANSGQRGHMICIKSDGITRELSPVASFQGYSSSAEDMKTFFLDLLYKTRFTSERIRDDFSDWGDKLSASATMFARKFCSVVLESWTPSLNIGFPDPALGERIPDLERAYVDGDAAAMAMVDAPPTGIAWAKLYYQFKQEGHEAWLDDIRKVATEDTHIRSGTLAAFPKSDGGQVTPVLQRVERRTWNRGTRDEFKAVKAVSVLLLPQARIEDSVSPQHFLSLWDTYVPSSVVRIRWSKKGGDEYVQEDMLEEPVVCAMNPGFAEIFDVQYRPKLSGESGWTSAQLLEKVAKYVRTEDLDLLREDQVEVSRRIIMQDAPGRARVPLQLGSNHPRFANKAFLPCLIAKHILGSPEGKHETYLLVSYVEDFEPLGAH